MDKILLHISKQYHYIVLCNFHLYPLKQNVLKTFIRFNCEVYLYY